MKWYWWLLIVLVIAVIIWFLYNKMKKSNASKATLDPATLRMFENECESLFNTQVEVDKCVEEKVAKANGSK